MAIHFISGKPGGGKSLYAVKLILEELVLGHRVIITNLPLKLPELNAYIQSHYDRTVDVVGRVWLLNDDQTAVFWTMRPDGVRISKLTQAEWQGGQRPDYAGVKDKGVMYVIDEIHNFFGSRQWAETGRDVLFYLSQHRKLSDTVVCITQAIGNVDKQFRSVAQDYTFLRNLSKERYGMFRLPGIFVRKTFSSPPTDTTAPMETGTFKLDVSGIAACYDSAAGVGIHGRSADTGEKNRGRHPAWGFAAVAVAALVIFWGAPKALAYYYTKPLRQLNTPSAALPLPVPVSLPAVPSSAPPSNHPPPEKTPHIESQGVKNSDTLPKVTLVGISLVPGREAWMLSDGRLLDRSSGIALTWGKTWLLVDGQRYELAPPAKSSR